LHLYLWVPLLNPSSNILNRKTYTLPSNPHKINLRNVSLHLFGCLSQSLNYYSIGIEHVNPGLKNHYEIVPGFAAPVQILGDSRFWYPFDARQFEQSTLFTRELQTRYCIPGWNVVTHADIAIGRKSDTGPMWPYKIAFDGYNVGYYYSETHQVVLDYFKGFEDSDYITLIEAFGYVRQQNSARCFIQAYQYHFDQLDISGEMTESTKLSVLKHAIGMLGYVDPTSHTQNTFFRECYLKWAEENPEKAKSFSEYF
jgi:hypothetical protein